MKGRINNAERRVVSMRRLSFSLARKQRNWFRWDL